MLQTSAVGRFILRCAMFAVAHKTFTLGSTLSYVPKFPAAATRSPQCHSFIEHMCRLYETSGSYVRLDYVQQLLPFLSRVLHLVVLILHQLVVISYFR